MARAGSEAVGVAGDPRAEPRERRWAKRSRRDWGVTCGSADKSRDGMRGGGGPVTMAAAAGIADGAGDVAGGGCGGPGAGGATLRGVARGLRGLGGCESALRGVVGREPDAAESSGDSAPSGRGGGGAVGEDEAKAAGCVAAGTGGAPRGPRGDGRRPDELRGGVERPTCERSGRRVGGGTGGGKRCVVVTFFHFDAQSTPRSFLLPSPSPCVTEDGTRVTYALHRPSRRTLQQTEARRPGGLSASGNEADPVATPWLGGDEATPAVREVIDRSDVEAAAAAVGALGAAGTAGTAKRLRLGGGGTAADSSVEEVIGALEGEKAENKSSKHKAHRSRWLGWGEEKTETSGPTG